MPFKNIDGRHRLGPFKFVKEEWVPGNKVVYVKNTDYVPRKEPPSWAAGGKVVKVDRVEWIYIPDSATAAAALNAGEADWWEQLPPDLIPLLAQEQGHHRREHRPAGSMGMIRFNLLHPPFNNQKMRQALLYAVDQKDYVIGIAGDPKNGKPCYSYFTCGTPLVVRGRRRAAEGQARLREGQAADQGSRLQGREDRHHRRHRPADRALAVAADARDPEEARASTSRSRRATGAR